MFITENKSKYFNNRKQTFPYPFQQMNCDFSVHAKILFQYLSKFCLKEFNNAILNYKSRTLKVKYNLYKMRKVKYKKTV